ncbi:MAG TPA: YetF domain-containing protein [Jiangellaceae bacterium]|nr:YetF domain-containing protein [Jiangellaceae bacterium]
MDATYLWTGWSPIVHTLLVGAGGYVTLVLMLRGTGLRRIAKMTTLDFVIAAAVGSTFGRAVTASEVGLVQILVALVLLVFLQWLFATARARWHWLRRALDSPPVLLYYDGAMQDSSLRHHRLTELDVQAAVRKSGHGSLASVQAVVLHEDGTLGVITGDAIGDGSSLLPYVETHDR